MIKLFSYIEQYLKLSESEKKSIAENCCFIELKKGDYFLQLNEHCNKIGFVNKGILRAFHYDQDGNDITKSFIQTQQFATNLKSFRDNTLSDSLIVAEIDTEVIVMTKENIANLSLQIPNWSEAVSYIIESKLLEKMKHRTRMVNQDATVRYLDFLTTHKNLVNQVPLRHIASYLGITQSSLSRIRKSVLKNNFLPNDKI
ncbi:MAG: Crp/Fnr family transcriptional regulator [Flavobacteriales bacterium]|nr:Crp/Fnr family transcriptional regulator [Flavobacteriales bacterium]